MKVMKDFNVTVLYIDADGDTQQEMFTVACVSAEIAESHVRKVIESEGGKVTVVRTRR